ncbi:MAG: glycosyltransferase family 1 protein [Mesorhizobium sp.]|uniref:glycosyltransferase family 1 protein n=1 Tax=Mesorhizobium sp. TaxID=1871066 RepID=UPI000FE595A0|nr:glycosyltransferase family 1 protein [Mesorhizobium sp.]RWB07931.1 MAG: glycosyltransferase family 1 protein [Mesorhizobium sp.]RWB15701.1 MAG: glycosyltransferase family 1 protein [Mesorhizobium sp.]
MANVLMIIEAKIATTYLLEQIMGACRVHGVDHKVKFLNELHVDDITLDTIPMFVRCADPHVLSWTQLLADANRSYVYYIDDNFWRILGDNPLALYYRHPIVRKSLDFAVSHAAIVMVNSSELARFISRYNTRIEVLPTFFDFSLVEEVTPSYTDETRIGFAGSPSRVDDLEMISPLIEPILERFPKAVFEFAGVLPRGVRTEARVRFFPHTGDYNNYVKFQASRNWAIGLAPLIDHEANRSKTDNKYREYGAFRIAGIYSNIPPYSDVVRSPVTGLLVANTKDSWLEAISVMMESPQEREILTRMAFEDVKNRYDLNVVSREWADVFIRFDEARSINTKPLRGGKIEIKKFWRYIERYWLSFWVVYKTGGIYLVSKRIVKKILRLV